MPGADDRRPLLAPSADDNDDGVLSKKNQDYASVQIIPREETGSSGLEDGGENGDLDEVDIEAKEKEANRRMAKLVSLC